VVALQELFIDSFMTTSGWQIDGYTVMISDVSDVWTFEALKAVEGAQIANEYRPQVFPRCAEHGIETPGRPLRRHGHRGAGNQRHHPPRGFAKPFRAFDDDPSTPTPRSSAIRPPRTPP